MTIFKLPRVLIHIPGETSRDKFAPEYEFPLFSRLYRGRISDPGGNPLRILPHPKGAQYHDFWYEVEAADVSELVSYEAIRLRNQFGVDEKSGENVFDLVYPGSYFNDAIVAALASAEKHITDPLRADPVDKIWPLCNKLGMDRTIAKRLVEVGWSDLELMAAADLDQLSRTVGKVRAAQLIKVAESELNALINMEPAEMIQTAKGAAKGIKG